MKQGEPVIKCKLTFEAKDGWFTRQIEIGGTDLVMEFEKAWEWVVRDFQEYRQSVDGGFNQRVASLLNKFGSERLMASLDFLEKQMDIIDGHYERTRHPDIK